jgi:soluble lytic murein transglycosylase-like protein
MSINQLENNQGTPSIHSSPKTLTKKDLPSVTFSEAINRATQNLSSQTSRNPAAVATAAAELLQLEMMKSALTLGGETTALSPKPLNFPVDFAVADYTPKSQKIDSSRYTLLPPEKTTITPSSSFNPEVTVQEIVSKASQKFGVDEALIKAVIKTESNFKASAVSHAGAQGLMQLMPATARGLGVKDSFDPEQNIMAGTRFLKDMINRYNGNLDSALAAYNWGPGNVDRKGTSSLPQETREYLVKVKSYYNQYIG